MPINNDHIVYLSFPYFKVQYLFAVSAEMTQNCSEKEKKQIPYKNDR